MSLSVILFFLAGVIAFIACFIAFLKTSRHVNVVVRFLASSSFTLALGVRVSIGGDFLGTWLTSSESFVMLLALLAWSAAFFISCPAFIRTASPFAKYTSLIGFGCATFILIGTTWIIFLNACVSW